MLNISLGAHGTPHGRAVSALNLIAVCFIVLLSSTVVAADPSPTTRLSGEATIHAPAGDSEIVIKTASGMAGAIQSLTWNGKEFIDHADHGRELQSALGLGTGGHGFNPETFNPTEAGSRDDGDGPTSTSRLLEIVAEGASLRTLSQMAFWLKPGESSSGQIARNDKALSEYLMEKRVWIGFRKLDHVIKYEVDFDFPVGEKHSLAQIEALTGYMPSEFDHFYRLNTATGALQPISDGPGEQFDPLVFATFSGSHAMGIYAPPQEQPEVGRASYGRFRFVAEKVVKWNCVFRIRDPAGVPSGKHSLRMFVVVGTQEDVRTAMIALSKTLVR